MFNYIKLKAKYNTLNIKYLASEEELNKTKDELIEIQQKYILALEKAKELKRELKEIKLKGEKNSMSIDEKTKIEEPDLESIKDEIKDDIDFAANYIFTLNKCYNRLVDKVIELNKENKHLKTEIEFLNRGLHK